MKITILNVAYPFAPVGPGAVGGAEQVLTNLDEALVDGGHNSIVIACRGSVARGTLVETMEITAPVDTTLREKVYARHREAIDLVIHSHDVDLIHYHGVDFYEYLRPAAVPSLVTLHLPLDFYPERAFQSGHQGIHFHCVSETQRLTCPAGLELLPDITNGVDTSKHPSHAKRKFCLAMGRICPEKGFHLALDAAKIAGTSLLLAGATFPYERHIQYFNNEIVPRLDQKRRFIGPLGPAGKRKFLTASRCLLVPSLVAETSSLVTMEALACGTPVIAFPCGALPSIIDHGKTGFIVNSLSEMAEAIHLATTIHPEACLAAARSRFSLDETKRKYLELYTALTGLRELPAAHKKTIAESTFA